MSERRDDTPEQDEPSPAERERKKPGSYYYDDSTGYEIFDPSEEDEDQEEDEPVGNH
ncbi:MAG TPA: hypothetical protein VF708_18295 [Pyrinomonadaceae bacterium]|jgi:hypothetical protein